MVPPHVIFFLNLPLSRLPLCVPDIRSPLSWPPALQVTKKAVRDARDLVTELQHAAGTYMDPEELRMAALLRSKSSDDALKPEGVRRLYLTRGQADDDDFARQQETLQERGVPFYTKAVQRTIGNQLFVWVQTTFDNRLMLTNLELGSKTPGHEQYRDREQAEKDGWTAVTHESADLVFYVKVPVPLLLHFPPALCSSLCVPSLSFHDAHRCRPSHPLPLPPPLPPPTPPPPRRT